MFERIVVPKGELNSHSSHEGQWRDKSASDRGGGCAGAGGSRAPCAHLLAVVGVCAETNRTIALTITHKSTSKPWQVTRTFARGCTLSRGALS